MNRKLPNSNLITITETAAILGVSKRTLQRWVKTGKLHAIRPSGKECYFTPEEIEKHKQSGLLSAEEAANRLGVTLEEFLEYSNKGLITHVTADDDTVAYTQESVEQLLHTLFYMQQKVQHEHVSHLKDVNKENADPDKLVDLLAVESAADDPVEQKVIGTVVSQDRHYIEKLQAIQKIMMLVVLAGTLLVATIVLILTLFFLVVPDETAAFFGYKDDSIESQHVTKRRVLGAHTRANAPPEDAQPVLGTLLKPFSKMALVLVKAIDEEKHRKILSQKKIEDVNDILTVDAEGNIVPRANFKLPDSSYLVTSDGELLNNIKEEIQSLAVTVSAYTSETTETTQEAADITNVSIDILPGQITSTQLSTGVVLTDAVADGAITAKKLAPGIGVLGDNTVTAAYIKDGEVKADEIADGAVGAAKIADGAVTDSKLAQITTSQKVAGSAVQLAAGGGLTNNSGLSLIRTCGDGEVLSWNALSSEWECSSVAGGGGDITAVIAGTGLTGGGNTGSVTLNSVLGTDIDLASEVTGILPVNRGGIGTNTLTDLITLGTHTTGNYVGSISNGSGISIGGSAGEAWVPSIALGALTGDWNQSGAFDIVLSHAGSELRMLESTGGSFYGTFDVGDLAADQVYTFGIGGTVYTSGNDPFDTSAEIQAVNTGGDVSGAISNIQIGTGTVGTNEAAGLDVSDDTNLSASDGITLTGDALTNTDKGSSQNIFKTFAVSGQNNVVSDANADTVTLIAGTNVTITTDDTTDTITINATGGGGSYTAGNDLDLTGSQFDLESVIDTVSTINLAGTGTLNGLDAIDATTETTIETAIDTLGNLTAASSLSSVGTLTSGSTGAGFTLNFGTSTLSGNITGTNIDESSLSGLGTSNFTSANISQWTNDAGYITDGNTGWNNSYGFITASSADTLTNKSGNISQWTNDSGYLTSVDVSGNTNLSASNGVTLTGDALSLDVTYNPTWTNLHTFTRSGTAILLKPGSAPAANTKLLDIQQTGAGTTVFSVDYEGDLAANSLSLVTGLTDANVSDTLTIGSSGSVDAAALSGTVASGRLSGTYAIDVSGNAATVTNGVYTSGSYADPGWITSLAGSKVSGNISGNAANVTGSVGDANVSDALTISGGTINNSVIGGSTPAAATVTDLAANGNTVLGDGSGNDSITIRKSGSGNVTLTGFAGCSALETDGSGNLACGSDDTGGGTGSLDVAYDNGGTITVDAYDVVYNLSDSTNDYKFTINNNTSGAIATGLAITTSVGSGTFTTAVDISDADIATAIALGSNDVTVGGATIDATEFARLDGKNAGLVDTDDAVATAITGTGTLTAGATGAGFTLNFGTSTLSGNIGGGNIDESSLAGLGTSNFTSANISQWTNNSGYLSTVDISSNTNLSASDGITLTGDALTNTDKGSSQNIFKTFAVSGQNNVVTDANGDTLTLVAGTNVSITTDDTTDSITINATDTNTTYSAGNDLDLTGTTFDLESTLDIVSTINLAGTGTLNGLDAIDATSESTIEAAIDTLSNLTTVGTLTSGSTGAGFTLNFGTSTLSGNIGGGNIDESSLAGLTVSNFTSANISQWTNNSGYITDGNTNWDNSYNFITASSSDALTNKTGNISMWTNDSGYITDGNTGWNNSYGFITASSTDTLTNKSGNISQWTNDSGYLTSVTNGNLGNDTIDLTKVADSLTLDNNLTYVSDNSTNDYKLVIDNSSTGDIAELLEFTTTGVGGTIATAIDLSDADIATAIALGSNDIVVGGVTIDSTEFGRLNGIDAALVDINDGVATAITGTGTLTAGATGAGFTLNFGTSTLSGNIGGGNIDESSLAGLGTSNFTSANISQWTNNSGYLSTVDISSNTNLSASDGITLTGDALTNTDKGSSQNIFKTIAVSGQNSVVTDANGDTLNLVAGSNITITTDDTTDSITIAASGGGSYTAGNDLDLTGSQFDLESTLDIVSTINLAGTGTINGLDAIDATSESTIEAAIDTLANLTSASSLATVGTLTGGSTGAGFTLNFGTSTLSGNIGGGNIDESSLAGLGTSNFTSANISQWTNDSGYITDGNTGWNNSYGFITASSADTLTNKSGNISQWTNDSGYLTSVSNGNLGNDTIDLDKVADSLTFDNNLTLVSNNSTNDYKLVIDNSSTGDVAELFQITTSGVGGTVGTALNLSDADIATAIAIGSNDVTVGGATIDATEFSRLDGKNAGLVDTDDAVSTAITGTGTLTAGATGAGFTLNFGTSTLSGNIGGGNIDESSLAGLTVSNFTSGNISQWTNNSGYITDGNTNWDNSYNFITASSSDALTNKTGNISMWTNDSGYLTSVSNGNLGNDTIDLDKVADSLTLDNNLTFVSNNSTNDYKLVIDNSSTGDIATLLQVTTTGVGGTVGTALDLSDADIATGLALGSNDVTVNGVTIAATEFSLLDGGVALSELTDSGTLTAGTVDINGGAIDGTAIGATSRSTGAFTTLGSNSTVTLGDGSGNDSITLDDGSGNITLTGYNTCTALETNGSGQIVCGTDDTGGGSLTVRESDTSPSVGSVSTVEFGPGTTSSDEFIVTDQTGGVVRVTIGNQVAMLNQAETVTGGWTFNTAATTFTTAVNANGGITFDQATDTLGAHTLAGTVDANGNIITNVGSTGTDFDTTGALAIQLDGSDADGALSVDNAAIASSIFVAEDNGTPVFTIADGGIVTATANVNADGGFDVDDAFVVADGGAVSTLSISDTNVPLTGASFTFDFNNAADRTFSITNSSSGLALLSVEGDLTVSGGDITGANSDSIDIAEAADATFTFTRNNAGIVTITSADDNADAALTVAAGGTGALTLGDSNSTTAITSSDWAIDATGAITGVSFDANGTGNSISNIETADIANQTLDADDLDQATADGTPNDEECLTFETSGGGDFEWQSCGGGITWDAIGDPAGNGAVAMAETVQTLDWNTAATSAVFDGLTLTMTNDATSDGGAQNLLTLANIDDGAGSGATEALLVIDNRDANEAVADGIRIISAAGGITTGLDFDDTDIVTDIELQNGETIDNNTDGIILMTASTIDFSGALQAGSSNIALTLATGMIDADALTLTSSGNTGATSSNSGLEVIGDGLTLLKGCSDNQLLKYTDAGGWACADDNTGAGGGGSNWTQTNGILRPNNNTTDIVFGGDATGSAKFAFMNLNSNSGLEPLASFSGNLRIGAKPNSTIAPAKVTQTESGMIASGGTSLIASVSASAVYNGSLYVGTARGSVGGAEVYRYDDGNGPNWTKVSQTTPGTIASSGTADIASVSAMAVFNGKLYIGTSKTAGAEIYRYDGGTSWTRVSHPTTVGQIGTTAGTTAIDGVTAMTVNNGKLYVGTSKLAAGAAGAEIYRYDRDYSFTRINAAAGTVGATGTIAVSSMVSYKGNLIIGVKRGGTAGIYAYYTGTTIQAISAVAGTICGSANTNEITALAVYNGSLIAGTGTTNANGQVCKYQDRGTLFTNSAITTTWDSILNAAGRVRSGGTSSIPAIRSITTYNGRLYIGTEKVNEAEVYEYIDGDQWILRGNAAGQLSAGGTSAIDKISMFIPYYDYLFIGTGEVNPTTTTAAEIYTLKVIADQSYALKFQASVQNSANLNGLVNEGSITFMASASANAQSTGAFILSHGLQTRSGAYDVAEDYPTRDETLEAGDVVSIDSNEAEYVKKSEGEYDYKVIGVFSENPALRLSQVDPSIDGARTIPVALAGRVPVKVSTENGEIKPGDFLAASSVPGVAMKATKSGVVFGQSMGAFNGEGIGRVTVYIKSTTYQGSVAADVASFEVDAKAAPGDILESLLTQDITEPGSEVVTDRVIAGLDVIAPTIIADEIIARSIKADRIEGLEIYTDKIASLEEAVLGLQSVGPSASTSGVILGSAATPESQTGTDSGQARMTNGEVSLQSLYVDGVATISGQLTTDKVRVKESLLVEAFAHVADTLTSARLIVNDIATFFGKVIFKDDVEITGKLAVGKDTAGIAVIKKGTDQVEVTFEEAYDEKPVVTISLNVDEDEDDLETFLLASDLKYLITKRSKTGFIIKLNKEATQDIRFSWTAVSSAGDKVELSSEKQFVTPTIVVTQTPNTPTPTLPVTPTPGSN